LIDLTGIPFPPSANRLWRRSGKRIHRSTQYVEWLERAGWHVIQQRQGGIKGPYAISIQAVRPDKRRRDLSNTLKALEDLLQSVGTIEDDAYAEMISLRWVTTGEGVAVRIHSTATEELTR